ncbi:Transcription-repair-coupling factor [Streptomyces microflavus]
MDRVSSFDEPLKNRLGGATAKVMAEHLGLHTVGDLLHHYPRRYEERGKLTALADLPLDEHVTVVAQVADARILMFNNGRGKRLEVTLTDGSGRLQLVFFGHGVHKPHKELLPGRQAMFAGKASVFNRKMQLAHPTYQLLDASDADEATEAVDAFAGRLLPIYPACKQLDSWRIAKAVDAVLPLAQDAVDPLPASLRAGRGFTPLPEALLKVHRPQTKADVEDARARLKWDEAFVLQVALARRRYADTQLPAAARRPVADGLLDAFDAKLPFTLTEGQEKVSKEIFGDLATEHPMHRLLQGEVGSGKTMVALRAMLTVVDAGGQAAMLAPTEVLAQQHHRSVTEMMGELAEGGMLGGSDRGTKVVLLTGSMGMPARRQALLDLVTGEAGHRHRHPRPHRGQGPVPRPGPGRGRRAAPLRRGAARRPARQGEAAAAPARHDGDADPASVAMTVFGDLETSVLDQLPAGRSPIAEPCRPGRRTSRTSWPAPGSGYARGWSDRPARASEGVHPYRRRGGAASKRRAAPLEEGADERAAGRPGGRRAARPGPPERADGRGPARRTRPDDEDPGAPPRRRRHRVGRHCKDSGRGTVQDGAKDNMGGAEPGVDEKQEK